VLATRRRPTVRVNTLKTTRQALFHDWYHLKQFVVQKTSQSPLGIQFIEKPCDLSALKEFKLGLFEPQDEGAQLCALEVGARAGERVLDYCAGAGGKALAFAPGMDNQGTIYLHDTRKHAL
jgi:16S rRNA (cytosine967-C5)-methyltransferase